MDKFTRMLAEQGFILADGATGTNYFALGLETGHPPEFWNIEKPENVSGLHRRFLEAGADLILTNSFGGTSYRLKLHAAEGRVRELNIAAAKLAREAVTAFEENTGRTALVAGSMGPTGELFAPLGALDHESAVAAFTEQAEALAEGGVDLLWIETISSLEEVDAAMDAAKSVGLPFTATMTFDTAGKSMMGVEPGDYARHVHQGGAVAAGANCGVGPAELMHSVMGMREIDGIRLIAKGNCGIPEYRDGEIHYHGSPELMAKYATLARDAGMAVIGGCCGTTPEHIAAMRQALDSTPPQGPVDQARLDHELGPAWAGTADQKEGRSGRDGRRGRRRR
ncbi:betaine--homocysteine S-methyltransferase [Alphaproteobacteria bacterium LSUCC0684]